MSHLELREVRRLPAMKTRVALFAVGTLDPEDFHTAVVGKLLLEGMPAHKIPDVDTVYHETWREAPHPNGVRLVRCGSGFGIDVTAIDLVKWSRGRRIREAA
jgi:hypothetical protein